MKKVMATAIIVALILLSIETIKRTFVWRNQLTLIRDTLEKAPDYALFRFLYAKELSKRGMIDEAIQETLVAIKTDYNNPALHNNLGALYGKKKLFNKARAEFELARRLDPQYEMAKENLEKVNMILKMNPALSAHPEPARKR